MKDKVKKLILIAVIFILLALLSMPLTALAAGSQSITRTFVPTANAAVTSNAGDNDGFQTTPANAYDNDTDYAVDTDSGNGNNTVATDTGTDKHNYYNYVMDAIPSTATISGITVRADMVVDSTAHVPYTAIRLSWDGGTSWTTEKQQNIDLVEATYTYGGTTDDWGHTPWVTSELSDVNFRVQVINGDTHSTQNQRDFSLEYIAVSITFTPVWDSYRDSGRTTVWGDDAGTQYDDTYHIVYMKGTGFLDGTQTYNVSYYDGGGTKKATDNNIALVSPNGRGTLGNTSEPHEPTYDLLNPPAAVGTWHAVAQPYGATNAFPTDYSTLSAAPDYYELLADDTFIVGASAIPEFSTVLAAIAVAGLCFGIYYWMRKRYRRQVAMA